MEAATTCALPQPSGPRLDYGEPPRPPTGGGRGSGEDGGGGGVNNTTKALIAAAFVLGMGAGVWFDSEANFTPDNVASTYAIDAQTPNAEARSAHP